MKTQTFLTKVLNEYDPYSCYPSDYFEKSKEFKRSTFTDSKDLLEEICSIYQMNLSKDVYEHRNSAAVAGDDIFIGEYDNDEFKLFSFFHELGHTQISSKYIKEALKLASKERWESGHPDVSCITKFMIERLCWIEALNIAGSFGIYFSPEAIAWSKQQLATYVPITNCCGK